jgi:hypothetical protein
MTDDRPEPLVAEAAHASSVEAVKALEEAADLNCDPAVAEVLDEATFAADVTVGRLAWLRSRLRRLWPRTIRQAE